MWSKYFPSYFNLHMEHFFGHPVVIKGSSVLLFRDNSIFTQKQPELHNIAFGMQDFYKKLLYRKVVLNFLFNCNRNTIDYCSHDNWE